MKATSKKFDLRARFVCRLAFVVALAMSSAPGLLRGEDRVALPDSIVQTIADLGNANAAAARGVLTAEHLGESMEFMISLKMRAFDELQGRVARGEKVPDAEMLDKYIPLPADYQAVSAWLTDQGLTITQTDPNRLGIFAKGSVAQVRDALQVQFARISVNGVSHSSAVSAPSLPTAVAKAVVGVNGLQPHLKHRKHSQKLDAGVAPRVNNKAPFYPSEILGAYNANGLGLTGAGQTIGIVIDTPPLTSDLTQFWTTAGVAQSLNNITFVQAVQGSNPAPSGEESLDTEWASGIAPNAKVRVYVCTSLSLTNIDKAYQAIITDQKGLPGFNQVSCSFGSDEKSTPNSQMTTDAQYFASMAAAGITVFISSGDNGSRPGISSPSNDPSVMSVGGTSITLNSDGTVSSESTWSGSGGGISKFFQRPAFQTGTGVPTGTTRLNPDISSGGDPNTGALVVQGGVRQTIGGTSWGAPTWAGFCALLNESRARAGAPPVGSLGPLIYPFIGTPAFRDITTGGNGGFSAGTGYDLCTGIGTPNIGNIVAVVNGPTITSFSPPNGPIGTTVTVIGTNFANGVVFNFNGIPAQGLITPTKAVLQVPAGAASGPITVTTLTTGTSATNFTVDPGDVSSLPNLLPYQPPGWSDNLVVSDMPGQSVDAPGLIETDTLLVSFTYANIGSPGINAPFAIELDVDGVAVTTFNGALPFNGNTYQSTADFNIGSLPLGAHTVTMIVDPANTITETNEGDNKYVKTFAITPSATIAAISASADASAKTQGLLTVTMSSAPRSDTTINFTLSGSAVAGIDYRDVGKSVVIPAGMTQATISIVPLFNASATTPSTATVTLTPGTGYAPRTPLSASVTINNVPPPPMFVSPPSASPNPAMAGDTVTFTANATSATGNSLSYRWDFGDGNTGTGSTTSNVYTTPGVFTATVTVTDGLVTAQQSVSVSVTAIPIVVSKLTLKFNFLALSHDTLMVTGTIPVGANYKPFADTATVTIGTFKGYFPFSIKGTSNVRGMSFGLAGKISDGAFTTPVVKFTLRILNQDLFDAFNPKPGFSQFRNKTGVVLPILIQLNSQTFVGTPSLTYMTNGRLGTAK